MSLGVSLRSRSLKARQRKVLQLEQDRADRQRKMIEAHRQAVEDFIINVFQPAASEVAEEGGDYILYDTRKYSWTHEFLSTLKILAKNHDLHVALETDRTGNGVMDNVWTVARISW